MVNLGKLLWYYTKESAYKLDFLEGKVPSEAVVFILDEENKKITKIYRDGFPFESVTESKLDQLSDKVFSSIDEINSKIQDLESKEIDLSDYATKDYVAELIAGLNPDDIDGSIFATKDYVDSEIENIKSELPVLDDYALKTDIPDTSNFATIEYVNEATASLPENIATKEWVENQGYLTDQYDDSELKNRLDALESKEDADTVYDDSEIKSRIDALENKTDNDTIYDDSELRSRVEALEAKEDADTIYDDTEVKSRLNALEAKTDNDTIYDDSDIKNRLDALEAKEDKDTVYDDTALANRVKILEDSGFLTVASLNGFATKTYVDTEIGKIESYDDTELANRVSALEEKDSTVYDDTELSNRVSTLEAIDHSKFLTEHQDISGKQDVIEDLDSIRANANLAATAVQSEEGKGLFSGSYNDLTDVPDWVKQDATEEVILVATEEDGTEITFKLVGIKNN